MSAGPEECVLENDNNKKTLQVWKKKEAVAVGNYHIITS